MSNERNEISTTSKQELLKSVKFWADEFAAEPTEQNKFMWSLALKQFHQFIGYAVQSTQIAFGFDKYKGKGAMSFYNSNEL